MKCEAGQWVQITRNTTGSPCRARLVGGTIVKVMVPVRVLDAAHMGNCWTYQGELLRCPRDGRPCASLSVIPDADLEPLAQPARVLVSTEEDRG